MCLKKMWASIKEEVGFVSSFVYTLNTLIEMPYCEHINRRMICTFCPKYVVKKKDDAVTTYCEIAYAKRIKKEGETESWVKKRKGMIC